MPGKLAPQWWSPVMPVSFFLSSVAAGTALTILIEVWIARAWRRPARTPQLAAMAQVTLWSLLVYLAFRLGDMAIRGQFAGAFAGRLGAMFAAEVALGGILPLVLLARTNVVRLRTIVGGALLTVLGVVFNRANVVLLAMDLKGAMPQIAPEGYWPSIFEWGISIGLIAATIFLFGLGARLMPLLPRYEEARGD